MERFRETLDRVEKALKELIKQVQLIREMVEMNRSDLIQDQLMKLADKSERFTLLTRALPCFTGYPRAAADVEQVVKGAFPVEIGFTEEGWFCLRIPMLLPRKKHGSVNYIRGALYPAMREFFRKVPPVRYRESTSSVFFCSQTGTSGCCRLCLNLKNAPTTPVLLSLTPS